MAIIAFDPTLIEDGVVKLGTNDHSAAVVSAKYTPNVGKVRWRGVSKASQKTKYTEDWSLDIEAGLDWETASALATYLFAQIGNEIASEVKPRTGSGPSFTATVRVPPFEIAIAAEQIMTSGLSMSCTARPVLVPAA